MSGTYFWFLRGLFRPFGGGRLLVLRRVGAAVVFFLGLDVAVCLLLVPLGFWAPLVRPAAGLPRLAEAFAGGVRWRLFGGGAGVLAGRLRVF